MRPAARLHSEMRGRPPIASGAALGLWRGAPLADLAYEPFAQAAIGRLDEIRLAALEQRIAADLALGRHAELVGEFQAIVVEHPLRERLTALLMLALYRSGRQAEAIATYRKARDALVEEFGIEPTLALRDLERAILTHDTSLDPRRTNKGTQDPAVARDAILVLPSHESRLDHLLAVAQPLAKFNARELILVRFVAGEDELLPAATAMNARRASIEGAARAAVFTSASPADDLGRLVASHDIGLVLVDGTAEIADRLADELVALLERSPVDLAIFVGSTPVFSSEGPVFVPFGGGAHDWAALELAGWLASATGGSVASRRHEGGSTTSSP